MTISDSIAVTIVIRESSTLYLSNRCVKFYILLKSAKCFCYAILIFKFVKIAEINKTFYCETL